MTPQKWIEKARTVDELVEHTEPLLHEGAQHLAAALKEIARLQAQLAQAERVVIPEIDAQALRDAIEWEHGHIREINGACGACTVANVNKWFRENAHSVPASRVLKEGEVAVTREEWEAMCALRAQGKEGAE